jgi:hypothetical protein
MKAQTFVKPFVNYEAAFDYMVMKNMAFKRAGNMNDLLCVVPVPEDNYAVVDDRTAIELGLGYVFASSSTSWVNNPWA